MVSDDDQLAALLTEGCHPGEHGLRWSRTLTPHEDALLARCIGERYGVSSGATSVASPSPAPSKAEPAD